MKVSLKINKSLEKNAQDYFKKAKKLKKKIEGAEKAIEKTKKKLKKLESKEKIEVKEIKKVKTRKDRKWFEKFHWFVTSNGLLVIAGRDANTNEEVIKKYTEKDDIVLHTDMAGSPFAVIKKEISEKDIEEAADFLLAYSKAWKKGFGSAEIFYVKPDQVSKQPNPGEYLPKGAFMIRGKTNYVKNKINFCIGVYDKGEDYKNKVFSGPEEAAKEHCSKYFKLVPGRGKTSKLAKTLKKKLDSEIDLDEFIRAIPPGSDLKK